MKAVFNLYLPTRFLVQPAKELKVGFDHCEVLIDSHEILGLIGSFLPGEGHRSALYTRIFSLGASS